MKIWHGYGSEHSMNLVMIGQFKDAGDAAEVMRVIEQITQQVNIDIEAGHIEIGESVDRYSDEMLDLMMSVNIISIGTAELDQFAYEVNVEVKDDRVVLTTDEVDVSAFLKVLVDKGARVEVYSAHHYPGTGYGRGG